MRSVLAELVAQHRTPAILITHDRSEALALGNQLVLFERGKTVAIGAPRDLLGAANQTEPADRCPDLLIQGTVSGTDSAKESGVLRLSNVEIRGPVENLRTDADGRFQITAPLPKNSP
jgi:ABC-type proline/glycine betaine transport system ATPase subunit